MKRLNLPLAKIWPRIYEYLIKYSHMFIFIIFSGLALIIMYKISQFSTSEPTPKQIEDKISKITSSKIDEESIARLKELQGRNVSIESLFDNGRTNPFEN